MGNQDVVVLDGVEGKPYDAIGPLIFSPDSQRTAYAVTIEVDGKFSDYVVIDGEIGEESYDFIPEMPLTFSPDSRHIVFINQTENGVQLLVDDQVIGVYRFIFTVESGEIAFDTPTQFHFLAVKSDGVYLVEAEIIFEP